MFSVPKAGPRTSHIGHDLEPPIGAPLPGAEVSLADDWLAGESISGNDLGDNFCSRAF
jgi:hypothetical protein